MQEAPTGPRVDVKDAKGPCGSHLLLLYSFIAWCTLYISLLSLFVRSFFVGNSLTQGSDCQATPHFAHSFMQRRLPAYISCVTTLFLAADNLAIQDLLSLMQSEPLPCDSLKRRSGAGGGWGSCLDK